MRASLSWPASPGGLLVLALALGQPADVIAQGAAHPAEGGAQPSVRGSRDVGPLVEKAFKQRRHRFCHDGAYPLTREELDWCGLLPADDKRCPALRRACAAGVRAEMVGRRESFDLELPRLPPVAGALLWVLLAAGVGLVLFVLLRQAFGWRRAAQSEVIVAGRPQPVAPDADLAAAVETDVMRLLERARAAAAAGDHVRAVADAYAALLRKLEGTGLIRVEAHRTNGDYLRDLGERQPALRPRVKEVVSEVERVEFGGIDPGEPGFRWVHDRVLALVVERVLAVVLALGLLGGAAGCQQERDEWDDSPSGRSAVREVLRENGLVVSERMVGLERIADDVHTVVLLPDAEMKPADWEALSLWVGKGRTLVVAGKPRQAPGWLGVAFADRNVSASERVVANAATRKWYGKAEVTVPGGRVEIRDSEGGGDEEENEHQDEDAGEDGVEWRVLFARGKGAYALDGWWGDRGEKTGRVVVFADDRLFCNAALLAPGNARFLTALLSERGSRVQFAGSLAGIVAHDPVTSVARGRLAPAMLQLALAAVVFFLYRGAHFGRPRAEVTRGRRAFVDHVRALGLVYARARAGRVSLEHYGAWATERLAERLRLGGSRRLSAIAEGVAARTGRPVGEVMRLLVEARAEADPAPAVRSAKDARAADAEAMANLRALAALVSETGAGR